MIPQDPMMAVTVTDADTGVEGYVVIHNYADEGGCGGVRALPDVSMHEVKELARAMAYKYAFFRLPQGGAKAGLRMDYDTPRPERDRLVRSFGHHIALLLTTGAYVPWTDMNFNGDDLQALFAGAQIRSSVRKTHSSKRTAYSTFAGIVATAEYLGIPPSECRVSLEGFGNVGTSLAGMVAEWGGKVVAISNTLGAVINEGGIDVKRLAALHDEVGQACVTVPGDWRIASRSELFEVPSDIMVPGARVHSIGEDVAKRLDVKAIVPAANVPCDMDAEELLSQRGILLLPDFVTNGGGILGVVAADAQESTFFLSEFKSFLARLLKSADQAGEPPIATARRIADLNYDRTNPSFLRSPSPLERIGKLVQQLPLGRSRAQKEHITRKENLRDIVTNYFTSAHTYA